MIVTVPTLEVMTAAYDIRYVIVSEVLPKSNDKGNFKRVRVIEELGFWANTFFFHVFERFPVYETIKPGMKLKVKVTAFYLICHLTRILFSSDI